MNANASVAVRLDKSGFNRFVNSKAKRFVEAAVDAAKDELSDRSDLDVRKSSAKSSANIISAELRVKSRNKNILAEELGTETESPQHTVTRLVKDPAVRNRIVRKAANSLK